MQHPFSCAAAVGGVLLIGALAAADSSPLPRGFSRVFVSTSTTSAEPGTGAPIRTDRFVSGPIYMSARGEIIAYTTEERVTYTAATPSYYRSTFTGSALSPRTGYARNLGDLTVTGVSLQGAIVCGVTRGTYDSRTGFLTAPHGGYYNLGPGGAGGTAHNWMPVGPEPAIAGFFPSGIFNESTGYPFSAGLDVPAVDGVLSGRPCVGVNSTPDFLPLPADAVPASGTQVRVSQELSYITFIANILRNTGGGTSRAGVYWSGNTGPALYLPTTGGLETQIGAITPGHRYILGRVNTLTGSQLCYWAAGTFETTYTGPYLIPDAVSGTFNTYRFTGGTEDGAYFVGANSGFFSSSGIVNTGAGTFEAKSFFASTFPGLPQGALEHTISSVDAVGYNGVVFTGGGAELVGGLPLGPSYLWVFNQICGLADLGHAGGYEGPDGVLDNNDFIVMIGLFFREDARADFGSAGGVAGADGMWDNNDFIAFIDAYFTGCG